VWIIYLAGKLKAGVSGANGFAAASSLGPAAFWMISEMPLRAIKDGFAEITIISH